MPILPTLVSISEFRRDSSKILKGMKQIGRPIYLTTNNRIEAVLTPADSYEQGIIEEILPGDADWALAQKLKKDKNPKKTITLKTMKLKLGL